MLIGNDNFLFTSQLFYGKSLVFIFFFTVVLMKEFVSTATKLSSLE